MRSTSTLPILCFNEHDINPDLTGLAFGTADLTNSVPGDFGATVIKALTSFGNQFNGIQVQNIECGPVIVRVNLTLPEGMMEETITRLGNNLARALRVSRIDYTSNPKCGVLSLDMPIEDISNGSRKTVLPGNLADINHTGMALPIDLGVDVQGHGKAIDLAKTPHLLIAGQTGSGKSVCINSIIASLCMNVPMTDFDMLLVDPKGVELGGYAELPNVINHRVLVTPEESMDALRWLVNEMEARYSILVKAGKRNIGAYNEWVKTHNFMSSVNNDPNFYTMRYIVCVIDEFADLMMTSGAELTALVQRLAQKSRAVGIHLVLATQRPSVKVVTGDLKANLPCRIAFKVSSATDSMTILGQGGAEKLLGKGDMILTTDTGTERLHGVFYSDDDIDNIVNTIMDTTIESITPMIDFVTGKTTYQLACGGCVNRRVFEYGMILARGGFNNPTNKLFHCEAVASARKLISQLDRVTVKTVAGGMPYETVDINEFNRVCMVG